MPRRKKREQKRPARTYDERARAARSDRVRSVLACLLIVVCAVVGIGSLLCQARSAMEQAEEADQASAALGEPYDSDMLAQARAYNERLAASGQPSLGNAADPFSDELLQEVDEDYTSTLDVDGTGSMGSVLYPKLGIRLPISHGTTSDVLSRGAGHFYGTSMPVGGPSTHAVISAHRGLGNSMMFTRLGEAKVGDWFYVQVLGQSRAYRVASVTTVEEDDFSLLRVEEGRDIVTLLTCTPIGINDKRLLVTGERADDDSGAAAAWNEADRVVWYMQLGCALLAVSAALLMAVTMAEHVWLPWREQKRCLESYRRAVADFEARRRRPSPETGAGP